MSNVSSFTSLSRDNLVRFVKHPDFFKQNPGLQLHEESIKACLAEFAGSVTVNSSCGCSNGGNTKLLIPCLESLLNTLEEMKTTNPAVVADFVHYATRAPVGNNTVTVTIYYTRDNGAAAHRYEFTA